MGTSSVHPLLPPGYRFAPTDEELMKFYLRNKVSFNPLPAGAITEIDADELYSKPPHAIVDNPHGETREWYFFIGNNKHEDEDEDEQKEGKVTTKKKEKRKEDEQENAGLEAEIRLAGQRPKWNGDLTEEFVDIMEKKNVKKKVGKKIRMVGNGIGFWRSVGSDDLVYAGEKVSAFKIHYIYFEGSIRKCKKTHWRMEEYHLAARGIRGGNQQDFKEEEWVLGRIARGRDYCSDY